MAACWSNAEVLRLWYGAAQELLLMSGSSVLFCWASAFPDNVMTFHVESGWHARAFRLRTGHLKFSFSRSSKSLHRWLFLTWFRNLMQSVSPWEESCVYVCLHKCQWSRQKEIVGRVAFLASFVLKEKLLLIYQFPLLNIWFSHIFLIFRLWELCTEVEGKEHFWHLACIA